MVCFLHVANYSDYRISDLSFKVMNSNNNKTSYEVESPIRIDPSEQIRIPVSLQVRNYPIGSTILVLKFTPDN